MNIQKQQLASYQKNLPIYESLIKEIRDNQHEYSNRLQSLQNLATTCEDYESLKKSIQKYTYQYAKPLHSYPLLQINMPLLAATLYNLACRAESNGITIQFDVTSEKLISNVSEIELSDFTSTLVQNAIETCTNGDNIYIHLSCTNEHINFEIRNPVDRFYSPQEIALFFKKGYTTKSNIEKTDCVPHGIGLYNLMKHVNEKKGTVGADCVTYNEKHWIIFRLLI
ncbi:MAG: GHKL domain-containing protein [Lachnospiraceae bacterium]|nr:GHKL domain-containing protein [Lachnospiraceae bacterium]